MRNKKSSEICVCTLYSVHFACAYLFANTIFICFSIALHQFWCACESVRMERTMIKQQIKWFVCINKKRKKLEFTWARKGTVFIYTHLYTISILCYQHIYLIFAFEFSQKLNYKYINDAMSFAVESQRFNEETKFECTINSIKYSTWYKENYVKPFSHRFIYFYSFSSDRTFGPLDIFIVKLIKCVSTFSSKKLRINSISVNGFSYQLTTKYRMIANRRGTLVKKQ